MCSKDITISFWFPDNQRLLANCRNWVVFPICICISLISMKDVPNTFLSLLLIYPSFVCHVCLLTVFILIEGFKNIVFLFVENHPLIRNNCLFLRYHLLKNQLSRCSCHFPFLDFRFLNRQFYT